jgi:ATP sulfurylase
MIEPHEKILVNRTINKEKVNEILNKNLKQVEISEDVALEIENIANGVYSPLIGFPSPEDIDSILETWKLKNGVVFPIPPLLHVKKQDFENINPGEEILLIYNKDPFAVINVDGKTILNKEKYINKIFKTTDIEHPGVLFVSEINEFLITGPILKFGENHFFQEDSLTPIQMRKEIEKRNWGSITVFSTTNIPHKAHEYLQRTALEISDGLLIHALYQVTKPMKFSKGQIKDCYDVLINNFYPKEKVIFSFLPILPRSAGPRSSLMQAIIRQNFGCTHQIFGRDHEGFKNIYTKYESQEIFNSFPEIKLKPLKLKGPYYCKKCRQITTENSCNHNENEKINISGTYLRKIIENKEEIPEFFLRKEVLENLKEKKFKKIFVLGIDGAMPEFFFGQWLDELPNIKKLLKKGCFAKLNSSIPPVSVVAWSSMTTGKNPADHGVFECLHRKEGSLGDFRIVTANDVKARRIWDILSGYGKKTIACTTPLTWPIKPFNGFLISGFMTPLTSETEFTFPKELKKEINSVIGKPFEIDIDDYRNLTKKSLLDKTYKITQMHIDAMKHLLKNKEWDLFFGVINGTDRTNHGFWRYCDKKHRKYVPGSEFENSLKDFYKFIDKEIGELLNLLDEDTLIMILSDHGITRMHNRVNLSDWLIKQGYLVLKEDIKVNQPTKFEHSMINWKKTRVFAMGAFDGQIFINLKEREPLGIVSSEDYETLLEELEEKLKQIKGDDGKTLNTKIFKKKDFFKGKYENSAPDMIVYFDDLEYGCNTSRIGNPTLWSPRTALGSDDAAHSSQGIFIMDKSLQKGDIGEINIIDIVPTILNKFNLKIPEDLKGRVIR